MKCKITKSCFVPGLSMCEVGSVVDVPEKYQAAVLAHYGEEVKANKAERPAKKSEDRDDQVRGPKGK